jgi:zinc/manganese transport system substrate-binding protein
MRIVLILVLLAALAAGCGSATASRRPLVVASTNVYGDIAAQLGGGRVAVTSILSDPNADPHLYEPGTNTGLAVAHARLVIANGLGYDSFVDKLAAASPNPSRVRLTVAAALGVRAAAANPHLWYDVPRLPEIADAIERALERAVPGGAPSFRVRLQRFEASLGPLERTVAAIRHDHAGEPVAYTERVPGYLLEAAGLRNLAPPAFTRALEDGSDPPPAAVAQMIDLVAHRRVRVLLYNDQAVSPISARVREAAEHAGVPIVGVSETLPRGATFQGWQLAQSKALQAALGG